MINTLRACGPKDRPWLDRYLAPLNIILAVLVSARSLLGNAVTVAGLTAQIGVILLVGTLVPPNLLHLERFKRGASFMLTDTLEDKVLAAALDLLILGNLTEPVFMA